MHLQYGACCCFLIVSGLLLRPKLVDGALSRRAPLSPTSPILLVWLELGVLIGVFLKLSDVLHTACRIPSEVATAWRQW